MIRNVNILPEGKETTKGLLQNDTYLDLVKFFCMRTVPRDMKETNKYWWGFVGWGKRGNAWLKAVQRMWLAPHVF